MIRSVCVFCGSAPGARPSYSRAAEEMGMALAKAGLTLVYGGGKLGLMGIVADAVLKAGGRVVGVIPRMLIERECAHPEPHDPARRRRRCTSARRSWRTCPMPSSGLPGGMGTFDELVEIVTWAQLGLHAKPVILANIDELFRSPCTPCWITRCRRDSSPPKAARAGVMRIRWRRSCESLRKKGLPEREVLDLPGGGPRICALSRKRE